MAKYIEKCGQLRVKNELCRHLARYHLLTLVMKPEPELIVIKPNSICYGLSEIALQFLFIHPEISWIG